VSPDNNGDASRLEFLFENAVRFSESFLNVAEGSVSFIGDVASPLLMDEHCAGSSRLFRIEDPRPWVVLHLDQADRSLGGFTRVCGESRYLVPDESHPLLAEHELVGQRGNEAELMVRNVLGRDDGPNARYLAGTRTSSRRMRAWGKGLRRILP